MEAYGLWPGVVAIAADADMRCVLCAKRVYGEEAIQAVVDGTPGYECLTDGEGNPFGVVLRGSEDVHAGYCRDCGESLCEEGCSCYVRCPVCLRERENPDFVLCSVCGVLFEGTL